MGVCRGRWWDVGACWSLGSCGVSGGFEGAPGSATFGPVWPAAGRGRSLRICVTVWGLGWFCSRSFGSFFVRGGVAGRDAEEEEEEGWLI